MRRAVAIGGALLAIAVLLDAAHSALAHGAAGRQVALYQLGEAVAIGAAAVLAWRWIVVHELLAVWLLLISYGMSLVQLALLPETAVLSVAYLVTTLVGSGLFLPWPSRWHVAWLVAAVALSVLVALLVPSIGAPIGGRGLLLTALGVAALVSGAGHRMWQSRLGAMLEQQFVLRELSRYARRQETRVTALNRELTRVARRDALTGVGNRLALDEALDALLHQGERRRPRRFAVALFDIDHFKAYNDEHGHLVGDAALERVGRTLRRAVRGHDLAFRYGGEEFLLLLPDTGLDDALGVAERVRVAVEADRDPALPPFTISGGVAVWEPSDGRDPEPVLRRADAALYSAKRTGRNRVAADALSVARRRHDELGISA